MPRKRREWKPVRLDDRGQRVAMDNKDAGKVYVYVQDWTSLTEEQIKSRQPKRYVLTDKTDRKIPYKEFSHRIPSPWCTGENPNGGARGEAEELRLVLNAVREFKKRKGIGNVVDNEDSTQVSITKKKMLSDFWSEYIANMRTIASRKTGKPFPEETILNRGYAFKHYLEIFGDHPANEFPPNVGEDFMLKAQATPELTTDLKQKIEKVISKHNPLKRHGPESVFSVVLEERINTESSNFRGAYKG